MKRKLFPVVIAIFLISTYCTKNVPFPITDLHIHLKGNLNMEAAIAKSKAENINYGIAFNCGLNIPDTQ